MLIKEKIQEDMKKAMKSQDKMRLAAIRLILAAIKQREVDERITVTDEHIIQILDKMLKQRRESILQFKTANRKDLVDKEQAEVDVIHTYMPSELAPEEISTLIIAAIKETHATSIRDMGKVMNILRPKMQGRADLALVSNKVKEQLSS